MDAAEFHAEVYRIAALIPVGKVTSYGHVAKLIGMPNYSRHVGQALKFLPEDTDVPWQRVISSSGAISSRGPGTDGARRQREALEAEGVEVSEGRGGELKVDLRTYGWFPASIEAAAPEEDDEEDENDAQ
ncbi:hypothetical protein M407DRAFT_241459 [Tulasnella calospora MUT 4182]|uniref:Methylated-DNA-[protein]-cysteine S-methyltransferase DNA binding domain-containing protein n=1 Tax=Tulasnella calospora MUT 4182 TaxID=1051891 RepID=A0A0C3QV08_9AGAM|nr:hypothetical protein M407DRAFT_241459 [Tulasnella calospora MUT 4182]